MPRSLSILLLFFIPFAAAAQDSAPRGTLPEPRMEAAANAADGSSMGTVQQRPKGRLRIGVALEGGGALGLAHISVFVVDSDIRVHRVAGAERY
ncbi:MAG: hypothetical protein WBE73_15260 [Candidatus Acidiferrum sp.]